MATVLDNAATEHSSHHRKFYWPAWAWNATHGSPGYSPGSGAKRHGFSPGNDHLPDWGGGHPKGGGLLEGLPESAEGKQNFCAQSLSCVWLFETPWTVACEAPLSIKFSRQEHWSGLLFPSPGGLSDPGIEPGGLLHCRQMLYPLSHQGSPISF